MKGAAIRSGSFPKKWEAPGLETHQYKAKLATGIGLNFGKNDYNIRKTPKSGTNIRRGVLQKVHLVYLWLSECQTYCWDHIPEYLFVFLGVTLDLVLKPPFSWFLTSKGQEKKQQTKLFVAENGPFGTPFLTPKMGSLGWGRKSLC